MLARDVVLGRMRAIEQPDVLIIGGGINGIGVFHDLACQGLSSLLVERGDFCSGTSAAPSRLIHGGLRYLETGELSLVRESLVERNRLLLNAPHVVKPIRIWVPLRGWTRSRPVRRQARSGFRHRRCQPPRQTAAQSPARAACAAPVFVRARATPWRRTGRA